MGFLDTVVSTWKTGAVNMYNQVAEWFNSHPSAWNVAVISPILLPVKLAIEGINRLTPSDVDTPEKQSEVQGDMNTVINTLNGVTQTQSDVSTKPYNDIYSQYGGHPFIYVDPSPAGHVGNVYFTSAGSTLLDTRIANGGFWFADQFITSRDAFFRQAEARRGVPDNLYGVTWGAPPYPSGDGASSPVPPLDLSVAPPPPEPPPPSEPPPSAPDDTELVPAPSLTFWDKLKNLIIGGAILTPATFSGAADLMRSIKATPPPAPGKLSFLGKYGGKIGGGVLSGLSSITYNATFGDFILEEAMQGAAFPISILIREKEYDLAQTQLDFLVKVWGYAKEYRDTAGAYNWMTGEAFEMNLQSVATQILAYQEILKKYRVPRPNVTGNFTALARTITDGDTIKCKIGADTINVRLVGINTPESGEPYYSDSKRALFRFVWGQNVEIRVDSARIFDAFGRVLGVVYLGSQNINLSMVRQGWAFYYPYEPHQQVADAEFKVADAAAQTEKRGIWGLINRANLSAPQGAIPIKSARTGIKVSSIPSYASIFLDGSYTYKLTAETIDTSPGDHVVSVDALGYDGAEERVNVPDGTVVEVHFKLQKL